MSQWHLYEEFKNGVISGGRIEYVWLFGIIGLLILLLACINFINLSTARSQKRAKEVGIRKTIGSLHGQLMHQFFTESVLVSCLAFLLSMVLVVSMLPFFNKIAGKELHIFWQNPLFWLVCLAIVAFVGVAAGLYPALYLASFQPVKVLKGIIGARSVLPRKVLVVVQFTVSIVLIISTIVVFRQIQSAKNRTLGYNSNGLITMIITPDLTMHYDAFKNDLKNTQTIKDVAASANPVLDYFVSDNRFDWKDKPQDLSIEFPISDITSNFGETIGWKIKEGRDFSKDMATDSTAFIINEAAVKVMGFKNAIGETIYWQNKPFRVIGVIKDMVFESPYQPVLPYIYQMTGKQRFVTTIKISPNADMRKALTDIETVFKKYSPEMPFDYKFVDQEYAKRFEAEERIGKLSTFFALLAIFISCLGLFGLASFIAEQRTKEIGIRKVLGASVGNLWQLLSKDFVVLVLISCLIAIPIAYYFMTEWLQKYTYRTEISWWIFAVAGVGALLITLLTVSFQAIKAAVANPVKALRAE
jgi:putative ABC transport system permease protein